MSKLKVNHHNKNIKNRKVILIRKGFCLVLTFTVGAHAAKMISNIGATDDSIHMTSQSENVKENAKSYITHEYINRERKNESAKYERDVFQWKDVKPNCIMQVTIDDKYCTDLDEYKVRISNANGVESSIFTFDKSIESKYIYVNEGDYNFEIKNLPEYLDAKVENVHVDNNSHLGFVVLNVANKEYDETDFSYIKKL